MNYSDLAEQLSNMAKEIYGTPNGEKPYSDTSPIKRGWVGRFEWIWPMSDWLCPHIKLRLLNGSKNWSMGSLNFDIIFFSLELGPIDLFFAYRLKILPPRMS